MANVLSTEKQAIAISALCEGNSIRSVERMTGIHRDTVMRLGVRVGMAHEERGQPMTEAMTSSHANIPSGLTLYLFGYPEGHESEETWCCGPDGSCVPNPPQCFIESNAEALKFGRRFGASRITNAITGKVISDYYV